MSGLTQFVQELRRNSSLKEESRSNNSYLEEDMWICMAYINIYSNQTERQNSNWINILNKKKKKKKKLNPRKKYPGCTFLSNISIALVRDSRTFLSSPPCET